MSSNKPFDSDKTLADPVAGPKKFDPDATVNVPPAPVKPGFDPDATVNDPKPRLPVSQLPTIIRPPGPVAAVATGQRPPVEPAPQLPKVSRGRWGILAALAVLIGALWLSSSSSSAPEVAEPVVMPAAPAVTAKPVESKPEAAPLYLEVTGPGGAVERRPAGRVKLSSNPATEVSIVKGKKLGRTPTEVTAEVGSLELLFENRELGISRLVTIEVRPGLGGRESIEFGRGWVDIVAPAGSKVSVDGRALGLAPVPQQTLYEGRHAVTVIRTDGSKDARTIDVVPGATLTHEVSAPPLP